MRRSPSPGRPAARPSCRPEPNWSSIGMRHVDWVRITIGHGGVRTDVVGVGHRRLVTRQVPLGVAASLIATGTPSVLRHTPAVGQSDREG